MLLLASGPYSYENVGVSDFTLPNFGPFAFTPTGAVFEPDMPAVPAADHFAHLHDAFAQRKSEMWAQVFDRVNTVIPSK